MGVVMVVRGMLFRVDRKREKMERKILDSQERAFWDVHRPMVPIHCLILILLPALIRSCFSPGQ